MNFAGRIISNAAERFFYVTASDDNGQYWYFMFIPTSKFSSFKKFEAGHKVELTDFGDIIMCGHGSHAPDEIKAEIYRKYKCQF